MKTTQILTKTRMGNVSRVPRASRPRFVQPDMPSLEERTKQSLIQWPSEQQILEVSRRLAKISQKGIRWEANGDYFNSGDLAYQLQEIIRATAELFKKSQRIKR
jgi:hypothetical protein